MRFGWELPGRAIRVTGVIACDHSGSLNWSRWPPCRECGSLAFRKGLESTRSASSVAVLRCSTWVGPSRRRLAGHRRVVLDRDRDPGQRPRGVSCRLGAPERLLGHHDPEGVHAGVESLDPPEAQLDQLARMDLLGTHELGEHGRARERELFNRRGHARTIAYA